MQTSRLHSVRIASKSSHRRYAARSSVPVGWRSDASTAPSYRFLTEEDALKRQRGTRVSASPGDLPVLPSSEFPTISAALEANGLTTFSKIVQSIGMSSALQSSSLAVTFLIPSNDAFETAASELNITSQDFLGLPELRRILELHALIKPLELDDLIELRTIKTQGGGSLDVVTEELGGRVETTISGPVNSVHVLKEDITAGQSIIHIVDGVLLPEL